MRLCGVPFHFFLVSARIRDAYSFQWPNTNQVKSIFNQAEYNNKTNIFPTTFKDAHLLLAMIQPRRSWSKQADSTAPTQSVDIDNKTRQTGERRPKQPKEALNLSWPNITSETKHGTPSAIDHAHWNGQSSALRNGEISTITPATACFLLLQCLCVFVSG